MSFNVLKFGINIKKPAIKLDEDKTKEDNNKEKTVLFPNCTQEKKAILIIRKKIQELKLSNDIEKLKEKKLAILLDKLNTGKQELFEKLNINTQDEVDPLCSFKEIQR
jgi:hypothetical protein